jgi:7-cyano-7-deazaguanine synthase
MNNKIVLGVSGGADSSVLLHWAATKFDEIQAITFNYGQRHIKELECAVKQCESVSKKVKSLHHSVIDVGFIRHIAPTSSLTNNNIDTPSVKDIRGEAQPKTYVPNRNMIFLSILAARAEAIGATTIWHGAAQADSLAGYWDGDTPFIEKMNSILSLNRENRITVEAPLITMSKKDIVLKGIELGVDFQNTWTCYDGKDLADAESASSSLRLQGFIEAGYRDPIQYKQQERLNELYDQKGCKVINYNP